MVQKVRKIRGSLWIAGEGDGWPPTVGWSCSGILQNWSRCSGGSDVAMRQGWSSAIAIARIASMTVGMTCTGGGQMQSWRCGCIVSAIGDGRSRSSSGIGQCRSSIVTAIGESMTARGQLDLRWSGMSHGVAGGLRRD